MFPIKKKKKNGRSIMAAFGSSPFLSTTSVLEENCWAVNGAPHVLWAAGVAGGGFGWDGLRP